MAQPELIKDIEARVKDTGDIMTGNLKVPQVETGDGKSNFFQCRKFRGEGNADTYYHAIDFGYKNHDQVDFHEYGGKWNFYKNQSGKVNGGVLCGSITSKGWEGHAILKNNSTSDTTPLTENSNVIATTAFVHGLVDNVKHYSASNPPPYPVTSVNGQTGGVNLTASDVGADASGAAAAVQSNLDGHTGNTTVHITAAERTKWNGKQDKLTFDAAPTANSTNPVTSGGVYTALSNKLDKEEGKGLSTNDLTATLKSNYDTAYTYSQQAHAPTDAEKNVIVGVQKNGTDLTVNAITRKVNITVPTKTSELTNDSSFVTTTDLDAKAYAPFKPAGKSYLMFSSPNSFTLKVYDTTKHWNGTLEYFNSNKTWSTWNGTTTLSSIDNDGEHVLYLRGTRNTVITGGNLNYKWVLTGTNISCIGNIESLLDYATVESGVHPTMASDCYDGMFNGCTALTQAPALPATTLSDYCYYSMFSGCTSLIQAPALPATTLTTGCYQYMFVSCTSLTQAPALPATTLASNCYNNMFQNCTSLTQAPVLPATTLATSCYFNMFYGCTSLTQASALPATTLTNSCYYSMFRGCTGLKISTTQTGEYTQEYRIPSSGTGTTAINALTDMFASTGGTFTGTPDINTTYYLSSDNMVIYDTEVATLREYVGSMIDFAGPKTATATLYVSDWDSSAKTQTVTVSGVLADETKQLITPIPAIASQTAYYNAGIRCTDQSANKLTFTAKTIPTANLTVYVTIQEVSA